MNMAPQELEKSASQYASDAIKHDSQGARGMAITNYQKATESLLKLQRLYPDSQLNKIYAERMRSGMMWLVLMMQRMHYVNQ